MTDLYGTDVAAIAGLPDPEQLVSGALGVAYALARRLLEPSDCYDEVGDTEPYSSVDLRDYLGARTASDPRAAAERDAAAVIAADPRVLSSTVTTTLAGGLLTTTVQGTSTAGPFGFVLAVTAVTVQFLHGAT